MQKDSTFDPMKITLKFFFGNGCEPTIDLKNCASTVPVILAKLFHGSRLGFGA